MTNILFHIDANFKTGMGHLYRTISLAKEVLRGTSTIKIVFFGLLSENACHVLKQNAFSFVAISRSSQRNSNLEKVLQDTKPALAINDILDASIETLQIEKKYARRIISMDDHKHSFQYADSVINALPVNRLGRITIPPNCIHYHGPKYMVLDQRFRHRRELSPLYNLSGNKILVTMGGTDTWKVTQKALQALSPLTQKGFQINTTIGPGFSQKKNLIEWINRTFKKKVTIHVNLPYLDELFYQNNIIVCNGGITLYECASLGRSTFVIANEKHEIENIDFFVSNNAATYVGFRNDWPNATLLKLIQDKMNEKNGLDKMHLNASKLIDGKGLQRVLRIISDTLNK